MTRIGSASLSPYIARLRAWLCQPQHKERAAQLRDDVERAFTEHPQETGETYLQHLWFTLTMCARFVYTTLVLMLHGLFPFLLKRAASAEIERIYRVMRSRVPKARRDAIDIDYHV